MLNHVFNFTFILQKVSVEQNLVSILGNETSRHSCFFCFFINPVKIAIKMYKNSQMIERFVRFIFIYFYSGLYGFNFFWENEISQKGSTTLLMLKQSIFKPKETLFLVSFNFMRLRISQNDRFIFVHA